MLAMMEVMTVLMRRGRHERRDDSDRVVALQLLLLLLLLLALSMAREREGGDNDLACCETEGVVLLLVPGLLVVTLHLRIVFLELPCREVLVWSPAVFATVAAQRGHRSPATQATKYRTTNASRKYSKIKIGDRLTAGIL